MRQQFDCQTFLLVILGLPEGLSQCEEINVGDVPVLPPEVFRHALDDGNGCTKEFIRALQVLFFLLCAFGPAF